MKKFRYRHTDNNLSNEVWKLYCTSFPKKEQRSLNQHLKILHDPRFHPYIYTSEQEELLAICFYWTFPEFKYLEHLAVNPKYRGNGIGSIIMNEFNKSKQAVILEIDPPIDNISKQRLRFYKRHHFNETPYIFQQVKYKEDDPNVFLQLLCNQKMNENLFNLFRTTLYRELGNTNKYTISNE